MNFKYLIFSVVIFPLLFSLAGCSSGDNNSPDSDVVDEINSPDPGPSNPDPVPDPDPVPNPGPAGDADNDGVADVDDAFPNDIFRAALPPEEFDAGVVYSNNLYVSPNGSNASGDGSMGNPYQTVAHAATQATPGTRINLLAGTYPVDEGISSLHGTVNEPIAIVANGNVIFDAGGATQVPLRFTDPRYVVIEGITIQNTGIHGMNIDDGGSYDTPAEHVILRNITFRNIGSGGNNDCLKMSGVDRFIVSNSSFDGCNQGEAIDMVGCHQGIVRGSSFTNIPRNAVGTKGGSADILIQGNYFADVAARAINAGGATGTPYFRPIDAPYEAARIRMLSNIIERAGDTVAFTGCDHCVFANNTIIHPQHNVARILQESQDARFVPSRYGQFINNIIVFNQSELSGYVGVGPATAPETFTFGNNLWYALDDPGFTGPTYYGGIPAESNSIIQQDPQINLAGEDYHIPVSSPAAGNGREVPGGIDSDYDGVTFGIPPDIGAFRAVP